MKNGKFSDFGYFSQFKAISGNWVKFTKVSRKHHMYTLVSFSAHRGEFSTDPEALEDLSAATKGKRVALCLKDSNISKELEKWIGTIQFCFALKVPVGCLKIPESLIQKKTLFQLEFMGNTQISDEATSQLLQLLKQEQFFEARISGLSEANLQKLMAEWRENASEMAGKRIWCKEEVTLDEELGFRKCTEEDKRHLEVIYPRCKGLRRNMLYCLRVPNGAYKSQFVFV